MGAAILMVGSDDYRTSLWLREEGYTVNTALNEEEALSRLHSETPMLLIVDVSAAGLDGWEFCRDVRSLSSLPLITIADVEREGDRAKSKELVSLHLIRPFDRQTLMAGFRAAMEVAEKGAEKGEIALYSDEELWVGLCSHSLRVRGRRVYLTPTEFALLSYLIRNAGQLLSREELLKTIWGVENARRSALKAYIWRLRQKIESDPYNPKYILTRRSIGYIFMPK
ncbi:MAG: winged helix-turn-helix domain-containing protein [Anaerolineae bacterium]